MSGRSNPSSSSRKGKKSATQSSEKPKQPQRGLGVAQLERIRLHSELEEMRMQAYHEMLSSMGGAVPPPYFAHPPPSQCGCPHSIIMGRGDMERSHQIRAESQTYQPWMKPSHVYPERQHYGPPGIPTRIFLDDVEDPGSSTNWFEVTGSSSQNSDDSQDVDLELKL